MLDNPFVSFFNMIVIYIFTILYKWCHFETIEDTFHKNNKDGNKWTKIKFEFTQDDEYAIVKNNLLEMAKNKEFLEKHDITTESILQNTNHKIAVLFREKCIYLYFNHYYISGPHMFSFLNNVVGSSPPTFLKTNPFLGLVFMPFYLYDIFSLQKKIYVKAEKSREDFIEEKNIHTQNKRCFSYLNILQKAYHSLQMNRPMIVALTVGFDEVPYIHNNVGVILLQYEITDTMESLEQKIKKAYYQAYCSNFLLNCPLPNLGNMELRDYVDCILSSIYIHSDYDFKIGWKCSKPPTEQLYIGSISILRSDNTMDINTSFNTCSWQYQNACHPFLEEFSGEL